MTRVQELVEQVKALTPDERDEFWLLLDGDASDSELSEEWRQEFQRRESGIEAGTARLRTWDEVEDAYARIKSASIVPQPRSGERPALIYRPLRHASKN